jgi:hypothetical protein
MLQRTVVVNEFQELPAFSIYYILGHFDIKTTEHYLHVARKRLVHIATPLDYIFRKEEKITPGELTQLNNMRNAKK